jgi:hypothetical protein
MHEFLVFCGTEIVALWFGAHWGIPGAVVSGLLGAVVATALSSTMDGYVSAPGAFVRWGALLVATCSAGYGLGWLVDRIHEGADKAHEPGMIVGGIIGLMLCSGIQTR